MPKGDNFGSAVTEMETLRDSGMNPQAANIFKNINKTPMLAGLKAVRQLTPETIQKIVESAGFDIATTKKLTKTLLDRQAYLKQWEKEYKASLKKPAKSRRRHRAYESPTKADFELFAAHYRNRYDSYTGRDGFKELVGKYKLTNDEALAVLAYTNGAYLALNAQMRREKGKVWDNNPEILAFSRICNRGLEKIAQTKNYGFKGELIRTISLKSNDLPKFLERWKAGAVNETFEYWSASNDHDQLFEPNANVRILIKLKNRHADIDAFSVHKGEREVLLPPGTPLKVIKISEVGGRYNILLEEVD
jgi:hypothetical protein